MSLYFCARGGGPGLRVSMIRRAIAARRSLLFRSNCFSGVTSLSINSAPASCLSSSRGRATAPCRFQVGKAAPAPSSSNSHLHMVKAPR